MDLGQVTYELIEFQNISLTFDGGIMSKTVLFISILLKYL